MALDTIREHCRQLRLPTAAAVVAETLQTAQREEWSLETFLTQLLEQELDGRRQRRITRLLKAAHLPPGKTLDTFEQQRLPLRVRRQLAQLTAGEFIPRGDNLLLFGLPGTGKTHLAAALGAAWVQHNYTVLFTPTYKLVDALLRAKRDHELERELRRLDRFQVVILDDLGYVQQSREEMEVLFTNDAVSSSPPTSCSPSGIRSSRIPSLRLPRLTGWSITVSSSSLAKTSKACGPKKLPGAMALSWPRIPWPRPPRASPTAWVFLIVVNVPF